MEIQKTNEVHIDEDVSRVVLEWTWKVGLLMSVRDEQFRPLLIYLRRHVPDSTERNDVLTNYMYMFSSERGYAYKHVVTRTYIYLSHTGDLVDGKFILKI